MSTKLSEKTYRELIEEDITILNEHLHDCLERGHIEGVLRDSVDRYYPNFQALKIADDLILQLHDHTKNIIAGSEEICESDKEISDACVEYKRLRNLTKNLSNGLES